MNISIIISTYNRIDDAKINMEIIRALWQKTVIFSKINIIHAYNGKTEWYPEKYLEDSLVTTLNAGHFHGAADLMDIGFSEIEKVDSETDYVIFLASDTWLVNPDFVAKTIRNMQENELYIATNTWDALPGKPGNVLKVMAVDFYILDYKWARQANIFPLNFGEFKNKFGDLFYYQGGQVMVEKLIMAHFMRAIHKQTNIDPELPMLVRNKIKIMEEREPVHVTVDANGLWVRKMYWEDIGLITEHKPENKQKILNSLGLEVGPNCDRLRKSSDLAYYNNGFISTQSVN